MRGPTRKEQEAQPDATDGNTEGTVWTIGHSTHSFPAFLAVLQAHGIETVADVRRFPGSRRHPQFGAQALEACLAEHGIAYRWFAGLGGRRRPDPQDEEGSGWRHPSFRAYAQHLQSEEFAQALDALMYVAKASRTAVMCSELLWWRCHRRLIADAMLFSRWRVVHILGAGETSLHRIASPAAVGPQGLTYVAPCDAGQPTACC